MPSSVRFCLVTSEDADQRAGFIAAYKEAFGREPYNEKYTDDEVIKDVWSPHREHGITVLAIDKGQVVGFGCCLPLNHAPISIQDYLRARQREGVPTPDLDDTWYMSDVGVLSHYEKQGIGSRLIGQRLAHILLRGNRHYIMRTDAAKSNSRAIYEKIGSVLLPGVQDVSASDQVQVNQSTSTQRVYLHGNCATALANICTR